ncbi:PDZ domain-containing protein [Paenibacillus kobensis]|uniref:PDZ domain-containing protein n=1 Tax=Paenibacillus kobensis TaxID=59841 RepID=UPI001FECDE12|nr:PDZ domain-containing protein [Paenibacillus kobensis]
MKDRSINIIYLESSIEDVWRAVVLPEGSNSYLTNQVITTGDPQQPKAGDQYTLYYGDIVNRAAVDYCEENHLFRLKDRYESMTPEGIMELFEVTTSYYFESEGEFTKLTLEVVGYKNDTYGQWFRECLEMGWRRSLHNLKSVLELGLDLRIELFSFPRMGIINCTVNSEQSVETGIGIAEGNYLLTVFPGSPADEAGLLRGDVILALDNERVPDYRAFVRKISTYYSKKDPVQIAYVRDGCEHNAMIDLTIDRMFTGLIEGNDQAHEEERERRQRIASERSASGRMWKSQQSGENEQ